MISPDIINSIAALSEAVKASGARVALAAPAPGRSFELADPVSPLLHIHERLRDGTVALRVVENFWLDFVSNAGLDALCAWGASNGDAVLSVVAPLWDILATLAAANIELHARFYAWVPTPTLLPFLMKLFDLGAGGEFDFSATVPVLAHSPPPAPLPLPQARLVSAQMCRCPSCTA